MFLRISRTGHFPKLSAENGVRYEEYGQADLRSNPGSALSTGGGLQEVILPKSELHNL